MPTGDVPTIGIMAAGSLGPVENFKAGLSELGLIEGQSIQFNVCTADGDLYKLSAMATDLVRSNVDLIAVIGAVTASAAQKATPDIPIVYAVVVDPVSEGLATHSGKPRGNMTGVTTFDPNQARTHVELLQSVMPRLARIVVLGDEGVSDCLSAANARAIADLGLRPQLLHIAGPQPDLDGAFAAMEREQAEALIVLEQPINGVQRGRLAELVLVHRLPTIFPMGQAETGSLFCYGTGLRRAAHQMARYAARILNGERPCALPIETLLQHELVVNLSVARKLGLTLPPDIVRGATQVIERVMEADHRLIDV
jgi:putative ABC transport system substrate-binding protein